MVAEPSLKGVILDFASMAPESLQANGLLEMPRISWSCYAQTPLELINERIHNADIVLTNKVVLNRDALQSAHNLKFIGVLATGMNNIDIDACVELGIRVENAVGYGTASVAQHTLMLMLMLATNVTRYQTAVKQGEWSKAPQFCLLDYPVSELAGKHLVIVGYGTLGKAVAKLAQAFDMKVSVAQRPGAELAQPERLPLEELLPSADFVSLHCALSEESQHLVNARRLALMKPSACLINTARGPLIDEAALVDALKQVRIAGAAVDVVSVEPPTQDNLLIRANLPNLIVTPHIAWSSVEARQRLLDQITLKIRDFLEAQSTQ